MKPIILGLIAVILYGLGNVLLEQKLFKFHNLTILAVAFPVMLVFTFIFRQILAANSTDVSLKFPTTGYDWWMFVFFGAVIFLANYCYTGAFTSGGNLLVISSLLILTPVTAVAFRTFWVREMPNFYHISAFVFAAIAVFLAAKGNVIK